MRKRAVSKTASEELIAAFNDYISDLELEQHLHLLSPYKCDAISSKQISRVDADTYEMCRNGCYMFVYDEQERGQTECPNVSCKAARYTNNATGVHVETHTQLSLAKQLGNFLSQHRNIDNINTYREEKQSSSGSYKDVFDGSACKNNQDLQGNKMMHSSW
ncbi:hypothetical protein INT47_006621 [Mucor saturninus]|uniref:Uncharacterized protein n=1 Tax=Mucor saturninus TaxID=64648 RepID=A0A8H7QIN1_9FUNG|nr:hypothetical protein INT47_006621 [Mucor saturninus]